MRVKLRDDFILLLHLAAAPRPGGSCRPPCNTARQEEPCGPPLPCALTGPAWYQLPLALHVSVVGVLRDFGDLIHTHPLQGCHVVIPDIDRLRALQDLQDGLLGVRVDVGQHSRDLIGLVSGVGQSAGQEQGIVGIVGPYLGLFDVERRVAGERGFDIHQA